MNFLADESVDYPIVKTLRERNYSVDYIAEIKPGISDIQVVNLAEQKNRILITADKDFGELTFRLNMVSSGIILYRLSGLDNHKKAKLIFSMIQEYQNKLQGSFTVVTKDHIRIKKLSKDKR